MTFIRWSKRKSTELFVPLILVMIIFRAFCCYTHRWLNVVIGLIVGFIVWAIYYRLSRKTLKPIIEGICGSRLFDSLRGFKFVT